MDKSILLGKHFFNPFSLSTRNNDALLKKGGRSKSVNTFEYPFDMVCFEISGSKTLDYINKDK